MGKNNRNTLVVLIVFIIIFPVFVRNSYYLSIMIFIGIHSLIAVGLSLLLGYAGQLSLGHAAFYGLGAYTSGILTAKFAFPIWGAFLGSIVLTIAVAIVIGVPSLKLKGNYLAVATLAFGVIIFILFQELIEITGGPSGLTGIPSISIFGIKLNTEIRYYFLVWAFLILVFLASLNIIYSRIGRALRSIHGSELAANAMGVNTSRYKIQIFLVSSIYAAIAGFLYAHYVRFVNPDPFDLFFSILLVMMVAIGGMRNIWGSLIGAALFTILPEVLRSVSYIQTVLYGLVLLLIMLFMPNGLVEGITGLISKVKNGKFFPSVIKS